MENLPTFEDVMSFLKDHLKIIISTILVSIIFYGIGMSYTIYSNTKASTQEVRQSEMEDSEELILTQKELDKLQKNIVTFDFYVENDEAVQFVNYNLLKELLIAPNILKLIQEKSGTTIEPTPDYAVNVSLDHRTYLLTISIGTGSYQANKSIADAYYNAMKDGEIPFFNNKSVYMSSVPTKDMKETSTTEGTLNENNIGISPKKIVIYGILALVFSTILGVIIAIIYSMTRKEISDTFSYAYKEDDIFLNFTNLKGLSRDELDGKIIHGILHPIKPVKLLLSEVALGNKLQKELQKEFNSIDINLDKQAPPILLAKDVSEINPTIQIDEVVIIAKKKETTKTWYKNQRIQLENYNAPVKTIQV